MRKQKPATPSDPDIKTPKIRKLATPSCISQTQPLSQPINCTPIIVPTIHTEFDKLTQYWENAKRNELPLSQLDQTEANDRVELTEKKNVLAESEMAIEKLRRNLYKEKKKHAKMVEFIEETYKTRNEIIEGRNLVTELNTSVRKHIDAIINIQDHCKENIEHSTQLYTNVLSKQQEMFENLTAKINDKVSKKRKESKEQFYSKCNELLALQNECNQFGEVVEAETPLLNKIGTKIEESEVIIDKIKQEHMVEKAQTLETIKDDESNLKIEREEEYKLEAEYSKGSEEYDVLLTNHKSLEVTDLDYQSEINNLTSNLLGLKEQEVGLNNQLDELKDIHRTLLSNRELEAEEYRKKIQDLTSLNTKASDKLSEAVLNNEEFSKILSKTVENTEQLENAVKITSDKIIEIGNNLKDILDNNKELKKKVETQNEESIAIENQIGENRVAFEIYEAKRNQIAYNEAKVSAELAMIEQQLFDESIECSELIEEVDKGSNESAEKTKELEEKIKEIDEAIASECKADEDLQRVIGRKQSEYNKKIQDATDSTKQCQSVGHEKHIREQKEEIDFFKRSSSDLKLKNRLANGKKYVAETREKLKYEANVKKRKSDNENLKKKLCQLKEDTEGLLRKLEEAQALNEKSTESSIPKPILKSATSKSPLKVQKVKFDLPSSLVYTPMNISTTFGELERSHAESSARAAKADTTNKGQIQIPIIPDEPDTTSPVVKEIPATQPRKFFKHPRLEKTKSSRFGKK